MALANIQLHSSQPPPTVLLSTVDTNRKNIKEWAMLDSGVSIHSLVTEMPVINKQPALNHMTVITPDRTQVQPTHTYHLDILLLPEEVKLCHIIPGLATYSLISVVKPCNAGCEVSFTKMGLVSKSDTETKWYSQVVSAQRQSCG